jgi:L-threonylcarbamoyladenylate synthase
LAAAIAFKKRCSVCSESTVISLADPSPVLLRPGVISRAELEGLIGPIATDQKTPAGSHPSPGMHPRHYSPSTSLLLVTNGDVPDQGQGIYLQHCNAAKRTSVTTIQMPPSAAAYAAVLYDQLHQADAAHYDWIAVDLPPRTPDWEAVLDRLTRAASNS